MQDVAKGSSLSNMVSSIDLVPTVLAIAGVDDTTRAQRYPALGGQNLLPAVLAGNYSREDRENDRGVLFQYGMGAPPKKDMEQKRPFCQAVITKRYKFGRWFAGARGYELPTTLDQLL